jgi:hypothetical protein
MGFPRCGRLGGVTETSERTDGPAEECSELARARDGDDDAFDRPVRPQLHAHC